MVTVNPIIVNSNTDIVKSAPLGMEINFMAILRLMEKSSICMVYRRHGH